MAISQSESLSNHNSHAIERGAVCAWSVDYDYDWQSDEHKARAIATDECWTLRWYVKPGMYYAVAAPTLDELLLFAAGYDVADEALESRK